MHFIYLSFSFLTLVFLSLLFVLGVKKNISSEIQFCVEKLTNFQSKHRQITKDLLNTNFEAKVLRASRKAAEVAVAVAPLPPAKAAAKAALEAIKMAQKILVTYQQYLINKARFISVKFKGEMFMNRFYTKNLSTELIVEAYPDKSDSPSYRLQDDYSNKKSIRFYKYIDLTKNFPLLLKNLPLSQISPYFFTCGATLSKKQEKKGEIPSDIKLILGK